MRPYYRGNAGCNNFTPCAGKVSAFVRIASRSARISGMSEQGGNGREDASVHELYIEFDGCQLVTRTDLPAVQEFLAETFAQMLVGGLSNGIGALGVFSEGDGYRIEGSDPRVISDPEVDYLLNCVKHEVLFEFMRARRDLLWLHAAAIERGGCAMLLCGPSGQGKSTLASLLCERGWRMMSDDVAPVRADRTEVLSYCQSVVRRVPRDRSVEPHKRKGLERLKVNLSPALIRRHPAPVRFVVFLAYRHEEPASMRRLTQAETAFEILRNASNLMEHRAAGLDHAISMARGLHGFSLLYGYPGEAAAVLDSIT